MKWRSCQGRLLQFIAGDFMLIRIFALVFVVLALVGCEKQSDDTSAGRLRVYEYARAKYLSDVDDARSEYMASLHNNEIIYLKKIGYTSQQIRNYIHLQHSIFCVNIKAAGYRFNQLTK